jgi:hypothetical protein
MTTDQELDDAECGIVPVPHPGESQDDANMRVCSELWYRLRPPPIMRTPLGDWLTPDRIQEIWDRYQYGSKNSSTPIPNNADNDKVKGL